MVEILASLLLEVTRQKDLPRPGNQKLKILRRIVCTEWLTDNLVQDVPSCIHQNHEPQEGIMDVTKDETRNLVQSSGNYNGTYDGTEVDDGNEESFEDNTNHTCA